MKKVIYVAGIFCLTTILLARCKKEVIKKDESSVVNDQNKKSSGTFTEKIGNSNIEFDSYFEVGNEGRFLVFRTEVGYNKAVENPTIEVRQNLFDRIASLNHVSWKDLSSTDADLTNDTLIDDDYFSTILSKDRTIQIENFIYKIDPTTSTVLALNVNDKYLYDVFISTNPTNVKILHFNLEDNVLELVKALSPTITGLGKGDVILPAVGCNEDGCGSRDQLTNVFNIPDFPQGYNFYGRALYHRWGIYFKLEGRAYSNGEGAIRIYIQGENVYYKPRCRSAITAYSFPWHQDHHSTHDYQEHTAYMNSRPLHGLHYKMRVRCEVDGLPQGTNPYTTYFTEWRRICVNAGTLCQ